MGRAMLNELKQLSGLVRSNTRPVSRGPESYDIIRFHHPDGGSRCEVIKTGLTLAEAQAHCQDPATSFKNGPTSEWWFDWYAETDSDTKLLKLW